MLDLAAWVADHLGGWSGHERAADLSFAGGGGEPLCIRMHRPLLSQLLDNLIENACKYSGNREHRSPSAPGGEPDAILLAVEDCGCGIPAWDLPQGSSRYIAPSRSADSAAPEWV